MKYQRLDRVVDAEQFTGNRPFPFESERELLDLETGWGDAYWFIRYRSGPIIVNEGDWIIRSKVYDPDPEFQFRVMSDSDFHLAFKCL